MPNLVTRPQPFDTIGNQLFIPNSSQIQTTATSDISIFTGYISTTTSTCSIYYPTSTVATISAFNNSIYYYTGTNANFDFNVSYFPLKPKRGPLIKKQVKSSIKRALKLISNFGMEEDVRIFLSGQDIEVSHPDSLFKFILTKIPNNLLRYTEYHSHSTPYKLALFTKTNVHVADLCVVMKETPILDQVLALAMFVKTGNEEEILEAANYRMLNSDIELRKSLANGNPMLGKKLKVDDVVIKSSIITQQSNPEMFV